MAQNTAPIYGLFPKSGWCTLVTGNTAKDGTAGTSVLFTAHATAGGYLERVFIKPLGSTVTASVVRFFLNNGSTSGTAANNSWFRDWALPAATNSEVASMQGYELMFNLPLDPGYTIIAVLATTVTAGWQLTASGSVYAA